MRNLVSPRARATLCISCHSSTEENGLTHRLYGAGHPRVEFEIDTYESVMPRHWKVDADYRQRKSPSSPLKTWLIGQAVVAKQFVERLSASEHNHDFSLYQCYSCHHNFADREYRWRNYHGKPGQPPLGISSLDILATVLNRPAEEVAKDLTTLVDTLEHSEVSDTQALNMLRSLLHSVSEPERFSIQYVEQATMAIATLVAQISENPQIRGRGLEKDLATWYKAVDASKPANPDRIRELALQALAKIPKG